MWSTILGALMLAAVSAAATDKVDLFVPSARFPCFRQPTITAAGADRMTLLAFAENRNVSACAPALDATATAVGHPDETGSLQLRISPDGGTTWGPMASLYVGNIDFYVVTADAKGNTIVVVLAAPVAGGTAVITSHDTGKTWAQQAPLKVTLPAPLVAIKPSVGHGVFIDPARCAGGDCKFAGRLVIPMVCSNGTKPVRAGVESDHGACPGCNSCFVWTDDNGKSWTFGGYMASGSREPTLAQVPSTTAYPQLYMNARNMGAKPGHRLEAACHLGGPTGAGCQATTSNAQLIDTDTPHWTGIVDNVVYAAAVGAGTGRLILSGAADPTRRANMTLRTRPSDGTTWSAATVLWPGMAAYSDIAIVGTGVAGRTRVAVICENGETTFADRVSVFLADI